MEYIALAATIQEAKFLMQLLNTMINSNEDTYATIYWDNLDTTALAKNPVHHQHSKDVMYHFKMVQDSSRTKCRWFIYKVYNQSKIKEIF